MLSVDWRNAYMAKKSYHLLWWLLVLLVMAGTIWYLASRPGETEYTGGILVLAPEIIQCERAA